MGGLRHIGRRLLGALAATGRFKRDEADKIGDRLAGIEHDMIVTDDVGREQGNAVQPNRAARHAATKAKRLRCTRNVKFHVKRHNPHNRAGIHASSARATHANVSNGAVHFIYNSLLQKLLWSSGSMDASTKLHARYPSAKVRDLHDTRYEVQ